MTLSTTDTPGLDPAQRRRTARNFALNTVGEGFWGLQMWMISSSTVLAVILRDYGAGVRMTGAITAVDTAALSFPQLLGVWMFHSRAHRKHQMVLWHMLVMIPFLALISLLLLFAGHLPHAAVRWGALGLWACFQMCIGTVGAAWMDWVAHLFGRSIRGRVMGVSFCVSAASGCLGALLAGRMIARIGAPNAYALLYALAWCGAMLSILTFMFVDDVTAQNAEPVVRPTARELLHHFRLSLGDANFHAFLVGRVLASWGFCVLPLFTVFYTSTGGGRMSESAVVSAGAAVTVGAAAANLGVGWLGDHFGHRRGVLLATVFQVLALAVVLAGAGPWWAVGAFFLAGLANGAIFITHNNLLFETCPHGQRLAHITVGNLAVAVPAVFGPLLAGVLAVWQGERCVFAASLALSLAALVWYSVRLKEPRTAISNLKSQI